MVNDDMEELGEKCLFSHAGCAAFLCPTFFLRCLSRVSRQLTSSG